MGEVESGVLVTFAQLGIKEPKTAPEKTAIHLARALDNCKEPEKMAGLSRELRQWLEEVRNQPKPVGDFLTGMQERQ
jgi:hypothetical protein